MVKGLLIILGTIFVAAILNLVFIKMSKISEAKKIHYRKFFWYFYGIIFMLSGGINLIKKGDIVWITQVIIGLVTVILNFLGKIEQKIS